MTKSIPRLNAGCATWLLVSALTSVVQATDRTEHYEVTGLSARELRDSMNRRRPRGLDGRRHDAFTSWEIRWRYRTARSRSGCAIESFRVSLDIETTVPEWINEADAPSSLVTRWREFHTALLVHGDGHKTIALTAAAAIRDTGTTVPSQPNCAEARRAAERAASDLLGQYLQMEREYDAETAHGLTQGARFP